MANEASVFTQGGQKAFANTPPERPSALPLTPPASVERSALDRTVDDFVNILKNHRDSQLNVQESSAKLSPSQLDRLQAALNAEPSLGSYAEDKLRIDYDPKSRDLRIRMPSPIHEFLSASIADEIYENIKRIAAQGDATGEFAAQIRKGASSRIRLNQDTEEGGASDSGRVLQRHPDGHSNIGRQRILGSF
ncbi:hypothetical protein B0I35DRAFT_214882 [Stachybotrys elegans]|uniref:Uncharacterized protein n=1 Tax=Stachybotrys elegans TaxID=80388 RepID=A0A8K0SBW6_9HYPO|nr:hypothetical protein B0I35DRAFT_214882 [Stachybotrys elegans]